MHWLWRRGHWSLPGLAQAQFSDSYKFLEAVKKKESTDVTAALDEPGTTIINTRDVSTGQSALHIVVARRDRTWMAFLIGKGANVNIRDFKGVTPLVLACNLNFVEGVELLIEKGARVDEANQAGETPLITAVHNRNVALMRMLLKAGANPDRADNSGRSARDYATLEGRGSTCSARSKTNAKRAGRPPLAPAMARRCKMISPDATLDDIRLALAPAIADAAVFDGWSKAAVEAAAGQHGVDPAVARARLSGRRDGHDRGLGRSDRRGDGGRAAARTARQPADPRADPQPGAVPARCSCRASARRCAARWRSWPCRRTRRARWSSAGPAPMRCGGSPGDVATDYNHYTKRMTWARSMPRRWQSTRRMRARTQAETKAFLDRRIEGVMKFEKAKARLLKPRDAGFSPVRLLGRLEVSGAR